MGAKGKYTKEVALEICKAIETGSLKKDAAALAGICADTFYEWVKTKPDFSDALKEAEEKCKRRNILLIQRAANRSWTAAAWWLERNYPESYALRNRHEISGPGGGAIPIKTTVTSKLDQKAMERLEAKLDAILRPGPTVRSA